MSRDEPDEPRVAVRGAKLRARVLDATIDLIEREGFDKVRIADVALAAGVHETSLYRRWKTVSRLLTDALLSRVSAEVPIRDTGSLRGDLQAFTADLARFAQTAAGTALIRGTVIADTDPDVESARRDFWTRRLNAAAVIVERAERRHEVPATTDPQLVVLMLGGLVQLYVTHLGQAIPPGIQNRAVDLVLNGLAPAPASHPTGPPDA